MGASGAGAMVCWQTRLEPGCFDGEPGKGGGEWQAGEMGGYRKARNIG